MNTEKALKQLNELKKYSIPVPKPEIKAQASLFDFS